MTDFWSQAPDPVPVGEAILAPRFSGVSILDEMPKGTSTDPRPSTFIVMSCVDAARVNPKQIRATLLVEFWAESSAVAAQMASRGSMGFKNSRGKTFAGVFSYGWSNEHGPTDFNDPDIQDRRRSQLTGDLLLAA